MGNQLLSIFKFILVFVLFVTTGNADAQTISSIKSDPSYIWGEGKGETIRLADQEALTELLNQIYVSLSNEVSTKIVNEQHGIEARSLVEYKNIMKTYSAATLSNTSRIITSEEPNACVLLGLKVALLYYSGHLAAAVYFTGQVDGDYILIDNMRYTICDPIYINAPVGISMPGMDNRIAKAILL